MGRLVYYFSLTIKIQVKHISQNSSLFYPYNSVQLSLSTVSRPFYKEFLWLIR
jgi:hypothetical protein